MEHLFKSGFGETDDRWTAYEDDIPSFANIAEDSPPITFEELAEVLVTLGANINYVDEDGKNILTRVLDGWLFGSFELDEKLFALIDFTIRIGFDVKTFGFALLETLFNEMLQVCEPVYSNRALQLAKRIYD